MIDFSFPGYEGIELHGRYWNVDSPQAILMIVHGFGEHGGRYDDIARYFGSRDIAVLSFDNRGHGRSAGKPGRLQRWDEFREDTKAAAAQAAKRVPTAPFFIMGHSLGGTIALDYVLSSTEPPRGVIVSAPALGSPGISPAKLAMARLSSSFLPGLPVQVGLDTANLSRDPEVGKRYSADPLVHGIGTPRLSTELSTVQKRIFDRASEFPCPLLLTYGGADRIAPREPIERFFSRIDSDDAVLHIFEGAYHEIHNDIIKDDVYRLYADWILARN